MKETGAIMGQETQSGSDDKRSPPQGLKYLNANAQNHPVDNNDSANGGLQLLENTETLSLSKEELVKYCSVPNIDMTIEDVELIKAKPRMPISKRQKISRHQVMKNISYEQGQTGQKASAANVPDDKKPLSPVIRRSAINNLVGSPQNQSGEELRKQYKHPDKKGSSTLRSQPSGGQFG